MTVSPFPNGERVPEHLGKIREKPWKSMGKASWKTIEIRWEICEHLEKIYMTT